MEVEGEDPNIGGFGFQGGASFVDHLCYFYLVFDNCAFVRVCLSMPCDQLPGKD